MQPTRRHLLVMAALAAGAGVATPALAANASPLSFLASIYDRYAANGDGIPLDDEAALRRWFSPSLADVIQNDRSLAEQADDLPSLDGDPFVDAQDWDIADLSVKVDDLGQGKATGHVSFRNFGEPKAIDLDLVETSAGWRVDDIHWGDASLRGLYSH